jgi:hypothetical protein
MAAARTGIGVVALLSPELVGRPWVGAAAGTDQGRLLARALGGRDLALGVGALAALGRAQFGGAGEVDAADGADSADSEGVAADADGTGGRAAGRDGLADAALWVGLGAAADSLDVLATVGAWPKLPAVGRWLVALSAGGAAVAGGAAAWALITAQAGPPQAGPPGAQAGPSEDGAGRAA